MLKVWINGSFDVLHMGHIKLFQKAKDVGDYLCVGIDSDERIKELKGDTRPINNLAHRVEFLQSIKYVDEVQVFDSDEDLRNLIIQYEPNIMVIGNDYRHKKIIGSKYIPQIIYLSRYGGLSTTKIINK